MVREGLELIHDASIRKFGEEDSEIKDLVIRFQLETLQASLREHLLTMRRVVDNGLPRYAKNENG